MSAVLVLDSTAPTAVGWDPGSTIVASWGLDSTAKVGWDLRSTTAAASLGLDSTVGWGPGRGSFSLDCRGYSRPLLWYFCE